MHQRKSKKVFVYFFLLIIVSSISNNSIKGNKLNQIKKINISGLHESDNQKLLDEIKNLSLGNIFFMNESEKIEIQSATFERLLKHLDERKDVQNIDLMNLANFCRNCLSRWYREEAEKKGVTISDPEARERIYGMPYSEWKSKYQK